MPQRPDITLLACLHTQPKPKYTATQGLRCGCGLGARTMVPIHKSGRCLTACEHRPRSLPRNHESTTVHLGSLCRPLQSAWRSSPSHTTIRRQLMSQSNHMCPLPRPRRAPPPNPGRARGGLVPNLGRCMRRERRMTPRVAPRCRDSNIHPRRCPSGKCGSHSRIVDARDAVVPDTCSTHYLSGQSGSSAG